jgi:ABC-type antimicrobial peptide transport system permease subunit
MGLVIGTIITYSCIVQRILFTQLPIPFTFPWEVVLTVVVSAMAFSLFSSIIPIYTLMSDSIVGAMRRLT